VANSVSSRVRLLAALPVLLVLCACGTFGPGAKNVMYLSSYSEKTEHGKNFVIVPGVMDARAEDPGFKAVANELAKAVEAKGYTRAASYAEADVVLYLAWRVVEKSIAPAGMPQEATLIPNPRRMLSMEYFREVEVEAVDMPRFWANHPRHIVWKMSVTSKGSSSGMEKAMPFIAAAIAQYMGTSAETFLEVDASFHVHALKSLKPGQRN
jgi:hypothetical protein